jgi:hypothetical protein
MSTMHGMYIKICCKQVYHIHNKLFVVDGGSFVLFLIMDKDRVSYEVRTESLETIKSAEMLTILIFLFFCTADIDYFTTRRGKKCILMSSLRDSILVLVFSLEWKMPG